ncbi:hypothetical protein QOT17_017593 [Balamuthia mandrillaris]
MTRENSSSSSCSYASSRLLPCLLWLVFAGWLLLSADAAPSPPSPAPQWDAKFQVSGSIPAALAAKLLRKEGPLWFDEEEGENDVDPFSFPLLEQKPHHHHHLLEGPPSVEVYAFQDRLKVNRTRINTASVGRGTEGLIPTGNFSAIVDHASGYGWIFAAHGSQKCMKRKMEDGAVGLLSWTFYNEATPCQANDNTCWTYIFQRFVTFMWTLKTPVTSPMTLAEFTGTFGSLNKFIAKAESWNNRPQDPSTFTLPSYCPK